MYRGFTESWLRGTLDPESSLSALRGCGLALEQIEDELYHDAFDSSVKLGDADACMLIPVGLFLPTIDADTIRCTTVKFPQPSGLNLNINMMPFKLYRPNETLPPELHAYIPLIRMCPEARLVYRGADPPMDRVAYLTVHESFVRAGETQRRSGIHIEAPIVASRGHVTKCPETRRPDGTLDWGSYHESEYRAMSWGLGCCNKDGWPVDGIYVASSVSDSCAIWPAKVEKPERICGPIDCFPKKHRGFVREALGKPILPKAGELFWMTDRTPHESLPLNAAKDTYRQFFRLVVGPVSLWYTKHNTANWLGTQPDAVVVEGDKYGSNSFT